VTTARTAYFSALDTVHFRADVPATLRDERMVGATGTVMLQMLLGGVTPLLSQTQAFDSAAIVNALARFGEDLPTLLKLARTGRVRVPILDGPLLRDDPADGHRLTLLNAFVSALQRPDFIFSAWPELAADPGLRAAVAEQLDRDPADVERITSGTLYHRLSGLIEFDRALRDSGPISARPPAGPGLCERVLTTLGHRRGSLSRQEDATLSDLETRVRSGADAALFERRSAWYALLDGHADAERPIAIARAVVDACYNQMVAASLGADGLSLEIPDLAAARAVADTDPAYRLDAQAAQLVDDPAFGEWLTWARLDETLATMEQLTLPQSRFRHLVERYREHAVPVQAERNSGNQIWAHVSAAPANLAGAVIGGIVGLSLGGAPGALLGGVAGALGGVYANYSLDRRKTRELARAEAKARREFDGRFAPVLNGGSLAYRVDHDA